MRLFLFLFVIFNLIFSIHPLKAMTIPANFDDVSMSNIVKKIAVIGKDDRTDVPLLYSDTAAAIGLIIIKGKKSRACTAFCARSNVIGTNAHCLLSKSRKNPVDLSEAVFFLPGSPAHSLSIGYKSVASKLQYTDPKQPRMSIYSGDYRRSSSFKNQSSDWAFAKLKTPICRDRTLTLEYSFQKTFRIKSKNNKIFMIGFHGDKEPTKRYFSNCKLKSIFNKRYIKKRSELYLYPGKKIKIDLGNGKTEIVKPEPALLPHTCDSFKGSSGSPILMKMPGGHAVVIAINSSAVRSSSYKVYKNRHTGKIIKRTRTSFGPTINMSVTTRPFLYGLVNRFTTEGLIDEPEEFRAIQFYLKYLKFYNGKIDGVYGNYTRKAIERYERSQNLQPIGIPTKRLLELLKMDASKSN